MQVLADSLGSFASKLVSGQAFLVVALILIFWGSRRIARSCERAYRRRGNKPHRLILKVVEGFRNGAYAAGRSLGGIYGKPTAQALTPDNRTAELYEPAAFGEGKQKRGYRYALWKVIWRWILRCLAKL